MSELCRKIWLLLLLAIVGGSSYLRASTMRWVHLGTLDAGLVNLAIDGVVAYRKMPPGKSTSWGSVQPGLRRFQIGSEKNPGDFFELEIARDQKVVIVSVSDDSGDIQSRTIVMDSQRGKGFIFNALPNSIMTLPDTEHKAIFGKGFQIPIVNEKTTVLFSDSEGLQGEVNLSQVGDTPQNSYLAILCNGDDGKPHLSVLRDRDSFFEIINEIIEIPDELLATVRIVSPGRVLAEGAFDPFKINWEEVDSQIFWLNMMIGRDPCRLEIGGFPAMRRMPPGRGSGFVKWPAGGWNTEVVVEATNKKLDGDRFILNPKSSIGLISSGGDKFPVRLMTLEGRSRGESSKDAKPQIRFVNSLPVGVIRFVIPQEPEPYTIRLEPGIASKVIPLDNGSFPGAVLDLTMGKLVNEKITDIRRIASMPSGDWIVIVHLDQESFSTPVLTWVEMDKGSIISPESEGTDEE